MECLVSHDLNRYYMAQERRDYEQEREDALRREEQEYEIDEALASCKPAAKVEFFDTVGELVMDCASGNNQVAAIMVAALLKAAKNGEPDAMKAIAAIKTTYLKTV